MPSNKLAPARAEKSIVESGGPNLRAPNQKANAKRMPSGKACPLRLPRVRPGLSLVAGVQPAGPVAMAATSHSYFPSARTRGALFPIVGVESASIDSDASFPCDHLCALAVNVLCSVGNSTAASAHGHGPGFRASLSFPLLFLGGRFLGNRLRLWHVLIRACVVRRRRQLAFFHRRPGPVERTAITHVAKQVREHLLLFKWHRPSSRLLGNSAQGFASTVHFTTTYSPFSYHWCRCFPLISPR